MDFRVGDMVRAEPSGPAMRVVRIEGARVHCAWRDETGHQLGEFEAEELELAEDRTVTNRILR
jgi:uncharacterized protein YodC (DUF2158 family)